MSSLSYEAGLEQDHNDWPTKGAHDGEHESGCKALFTGQLPSLVVLHFPLGCLTQLWKGIMPSQGWMRWCTWSHTLARLSRTTEMGRRPHDARTHTTDVEIYEREVVLMECQVWHSHPHNREPFDTSLLIKPHSQWWPKRNQVHTWHTVVHWNGYKDREHLVDTVYRKSGYAQAVMVWSKHIIIMKHY